MKSLGRTATDGSSGGGNSSVRRRAAATTTAKGHRAVGQNCLHVAVLNGGGVVCGMYQHHDRVPYARKQAHNPLSLRRLESPLVRSSWTLITKGAAVSPAPITSTHKASPFLAKCALYYSRHSQTPFLLTPSARTTESPYCASRKYIRSAEKGYLTLGSFRLSPQPSPAGVRTDRVTVNETSKYNSAHRRTRHTEDRDRVTSETAKALDVGSSVYVLRRGKSSDAALEVRNAKREPRGLM